MITAVDTSVLVDVFEPDPIFGGVSRAELARCVAQGALVVCEVVWAEVCARFDDADAARAALLTLGVQFDPMGAAAASVSGAAWRRYRREGGPRSRLIGDFLIGAHALKQAERLLTRDRGFHRRYFRDLVVLDPTAAE